jgi:hypothetical protein
MPLTPFNTFSACIAQEAMLQRNEQQRHPSIWKGLRNRIYLGGEDFVARMQARLRATESLDEIPKVQRHPVPQSLQAFAEAYGDRHTAMAAAYVFGAYTLKAIAAYFGVHSSTVSRAVRHAEGQQPAYHQCMIARPDPISPDAGSDPQGVHGPVPSTHATQLSSRAILNNVSGGGLKLG